MIKIGRQFNINIMFDCVIQRENSHPKQNVKMYQTIENVLG